MTWPASNGAVAYNVYRGLTPGGEGASPYATVIRGTTSFIDAGVIGGATYYYGVTAVDFSGESAPSAEVTATVQLPSVAVNNAGAITFIRGGSAVAVAPHLTVADSFYCRSGLRHGEPSAAARWMPGPRPWRPTRRARTSRPATTASAACLRSAAATRWPTTSRCCGA